MPMHKENNVNYSGVYLFNTSLRYRSTRTKSMYIGIQMEEDADTS